MTFPTPTAILQGAILHTIVHAIVITKSPTLHYELRWDDNNYIRQDSMGRRGVITFRGNFIVGAFSDINSKRYSNQQDYIGDWTQYFKNAHDDVVKTAKNETLLYLLESRNGTILPMITTAFWTEKQTTYSNDMWEAFLANGGNLISIECLNASEALRRHQANWEMKRELIQLAQQLYLRKMKYDQIKLVKEEYDILIADGIEGLDIATEIFNSIDISLVT